MVILLELLNIGTYSGMLCSEEKKFMNEIMSSDEAIRLIRDGDCICVNSFVGIESPIELHEALYRRYQRCSLRGI